MIPRDVAVRRPAQVARTEAPVLARELIVGTRADVLKELRRGHRRQEYRRAGALTLNARTGEWEAHVERVRARPPRWRAPLLWGCASLAVLGMVAALLVQAFAAAAALLAAVSWPMVLGGLAVLALLLGRRTITIVQKVTIR